VFQQKLNRMKVMMRGALSSLIYHSALSTQTGDDDLAAVTLMSNDIDTIIGNVETVWGMPASVVDTAVGIWLLWRQIGAISLVPVLILLACTFIQKRVGSAISERRAIWTKAIQRRVGLTSNLLRSMKSVKMSGLVETSARLIQRERVRELEIGGRCRWFVTWMNAIGKATAV
jgi:ATP-binding cassette, subfamily C (CFTR/MRP), member 1